jgi:hypothetical protein
MYSIRRIVGLVAMGAGLALLTVIPVHAGQVAPPSVDILIGQSSVLLPENLVAGDAQDGVWELAGQVQTDDYDAAFNVTGDPDPFITYSFTVHNITGRPLVVSEDFSIPVVGGPWNRVSASVSLAAVGGRGGFDIEVSGLDALQTAFAGTHARSLNVGLGGSCQGPRGAHSCYALETSAGFAGQYFSTLDVRVNFTLSGLGSGATVSGRVELSDPPGPGPSNNDQGEVPEPRTLAGAGAALALFAIFLRLRSPRS